MYLIYTQYKSQNNKDLEVWWGKHNSHIFCDRTQAPTSEWKEQHANPNRERTIQASNRLPKQMYFDGVVYELDTTVLYNIDRNRFIKGAI